jgi:SAM-dependent methyltransferase
MREPTDFAANLEQLSNAAWLHAAVATALELGLLELLAKPIPPEELASRCGADPELVDDLVAALVELGAVERQDGLLTPAPSFQLLLSPAVAPVVRAAIRGDHLQTRSLLTRVREGGDPVGWRLEDPVALTAQGETAGLIGLLVEALLPGLEGLGERMQRPEARILDVGAGVGVVSAELCRLWPAATTVGLEPHRVARELGRSRIAAAGLDGRVELRAGRLEELGDLSAYDLAFVPQPFLPASALEAGLPRVQRALRPGGWLLVLIDDLPADEPLTAAARRFRARVWGGGATSPEELGPALGAAGFEAVRASGPIGSFRAVCARRPVLGAQQSVHGPRLAADAV